MSQGKTTTLTATTRQTKADSAQLERAAAINREIVGVGPRARASGAVELRRPRPPSSTAARLCFRFPRSGPARCAVVFHLKSCAPGCCGAGEARDPTAPTSTRARQAPFKRPNAGNLCECCDALPTPTPARVPPLRRSRGFFPAHRCTQTRESHGSTCCTAQTLEQDGVVARMRMPMHTTAKCPFPLPTSEGQCTGAQAPKSTCPSTHLHRVAAAKSSSTAPLRRARLTQRPAGVGGVAGACLARASEEARAACFAADCVRRQRNRAGDAQVSSFNPRCQTPACLNLILHIHVELAKPLNLE